MYCGKCGKKIESTAGVCYSCETQRLFSVAECPSCASLRSRLSLAEKVGGKLAEIVEREMSYIDVDNLTTQLKYRQYASAVSDYRALRAYDAALKSAGEGEGK
jgi:hypothetical protein